MNNYTVLLLRPDYIANEFGKDTYLAHVSANGAELAQLAAQVEARDADLPPGAEDWPNPADYHVLFVALGHHEDLSV